MDNYVIQILDVTVDGVIESQFMATSRIGAVIARVGVKHKGRKVAEIRQLFVHEKFRRQGIARHLLSECISAAHESKCMSIALTVQHENEALIPGLYSKMGFIAAHEYDDGEMIMVKPLQSVAS